MDSETSGRRRREEEEQNVGSYGRDLINLIADKNPEPEAPDLRPNAQPWIPMPREEEEDGDSIFSGLNNDNSWEQIVTPVPEPQPEPQPEPAPVIDTGRLGANLNIDIPTAAETQSPVESVVPTATPTVTEPQTTSQPRRRGEERAEQTMIEPVTQPVTTPPQENTTPVTRPSRHSKTTSSVTEQNEQAPTPSSTYQEWMKYLAQQEALQQTENTQNSQFASQPDVSELGNGYVQPVTTINLNPPVLSGNDPMAQFADLFEPQGERLNPSISDFDMQNELERLAYPTARGPVDYFDVTRNIGAKPPTLEDPQWLQDLTGGNSLAGVAANALDSILRIGSGGPVQPVTEDPLAPVGDWLLGQMVGENNVSPVVDFGNSIAQNPVVNEAVREIGDYMLDQQLGKANADELRSRFGIETTPSTIMNQPQSTVPDSVRFAEEAAARRNNAGSSAPQSPAPQTTAPINTSGSQPTVFDNIGNWFSSQFGNNNAAGSSTPRTPAPQTPAPSTTAPSTTPSSTTAPQTMGSQGGNTSPYDNPNRYNPDSSAYYNRKFDDIMFADTYGKDPKTMSGEAARKLLATPVTIDPAFADLIASDIDYSSRNPQSETAGLTTDQYKNMFNEFVNGNPIISDMLENRELSAQDIVNLYFKNIVKPGTESSAGTETSSGTKVIPPGSLTLQPSYGQDAPVVKAPYRKGGYSEDEIKKMGNKPYTDYRGYKAYEGYYYNVYDKKWYPVDQGKANYYNRYGTYNGYGTRNTVRSSGGGGGGRGGGGGGSSRPITQNNQSASTSTPRRPQSTTNGNYYYGNNYNYQQPVTPNAVKQQEQRVNNIMKNWSF